jgi:formylglycine-generating enzyme required for sulfatase activity
MSRVTISQIHDAILLEEKSPQRALQLYKDLAGRNRTFHPDILIASVVFPIIGAALTFFVLRVVEGYQTPVAFILLCLSFGPAFTKFSAAAVELGIEKPSQGLLKFGNFFLMPAMVIAGDTLTMAILAIIAGFCTLVVLLVTGAGMFLINGLPFIWPQDMPPLLAGITAGVFLLFWVGFTISNLDIREIFREPFSETLSMIPVGIGLNIKDILKFIGSVTLGLLIIGAGPLGLIYESLWQMLLVVGVTGFLLGHSLSWLDHPKMAHLINLGLSRTHLALGHTLRARYLAMIVETEASPYREGFQIMLARIQRRILSPRRHDAVLQQISRLPAELPTGYRELADTWSQLLNILRSLAIGAKEKKSSIWLMTASTAALVLITVLGGGLALGYAFHDMDISIPKPKILASFEDSGEPGLSKTADDSAVSQLAQRGSARSDDWTIYIEDINGVPMALVPSGCFQMGSTNEQIDRAFQVCSEEYGAGACKRLKFDPEGPRHEVCFEDPFWIDVYEITNSQFETFGGGADSAGSWKEQDRPREYITWKEAATFCELRGTRLPTEAEWEYAARGPNGAMFPWGDVFNADYVVYKGNSEDRTWDVGGRPGGISWVGAYNMSGNVWEWVNDWYSAGYYETLEDSAVNPQGPGRGIYRVIKGGSWYSGEAVQRSSTRSRLFPFIWANDIGFRCTLSY